MFLAHLRAGEQGMVVQSMGDHSRNTSRYAAKCLSGVGLEKTGALLGLVHDCGKFKKEFQAYLADPNGIRGSVNHTFAGCRLLLERYHTDRNTPMEKMTAELLAFAIGAHHGLFDCVDRDGKSGFLHRMEKEKINYGESKCNFLKECASEQELDNLFAGAVEEICSISRSMISDNNEECSFQIGLLARLLLSALIEADRRDTAEFMGGITYPHAPENMGDFWKTYLHRVEDKLSRFPSDTPISKARHEISLRCREFAEQEGGIYRLNVPTGGGKTLSSLRYALAHGAKWGKRRIIFTSPLLSILEQNAAVIREFLGDDHIVLEHHSNILHTAEEDKLDDRELAVESWNKPVIITTLVQLLNTFFEGKTTSIRRFQGLCGSIIVIDEVQTVPPKMLTMFNLTIDFLARVCGATILLCSATQPYLEKTAHPVRQEIRDVIPPDPALYAIFQRTVITDAGQKTLEEIADFAQEKLAQVQSLLIVCNQRKEAATLYARLRDQAEVSCHLSASMCIAHRRNVLQTLNDALARGQKCLCVATQVIEAGVDISFQQVIRLTAGMDSVIQAAGRCNRNGESAEAVPVYVVCCQGENLGRLPEIQHGKNASISLLDAYRRNPQRFGNDLTSQAAIRMYYEKAYEKMAGACKKYQDYYLKKENFTLFDLMSCNHKYYDQNAPYANDFMMFSALKLAGNYFQVFDSNTREVVVPYGEGEALIAELTAQKHPSPGFLAAWLQRARPYSVSVYDWELRALGDAVTEYEGIALLSQGYYCEETGLNPEQKQNSFLEV